MMRNPTKYCDLVMKGGITSGLVYPQAMLELSNSYRFKNIGGTSAGAIAAAICAAAALGERKKASDPARAGEPALGMDGLEKASAALLKQGFMAGLFQPAPEARAIYRMAVTLTAKPEQPKADANGNTPKPSPLRRPLAIAGALVQGLLATAWPWMLGILAGFALIGYLAGGVGGAFACAVLALPCAAVAGAVCMIVAAARAANRNFLGLCPGVRQPGNDGPGLTDWMHDTIRRVAGRGDDDASPVTFGDLWDAPAYPDEPGERRLNLEIITTDASHSEPRTLPFTGRDLLFCEAEFSRLFPAPVVDWMREKSQGPGPDGYWKLPADRDFPIVVAARMSLSFPVLISAIPLYKRHHGRPVAAAAEAAPEGAEKGARPRLSESVEALTGGDEEALDPGAPLRRCWFTDGGVSSNFPVHLFDAPLPRWPTFAIDLVYDGTGQIAEPIFLPKNNNQGLWPRYRAIGGKGPLRDLAAFLFAILGTMQNWRDLLQGRAPGYRDRIVRVSLASSEGGMNIGMSETTLGKVAKKGRKAGQALANDFDFNNHFWVRYRNAASAIERFTISFGDGLAVPLTPANQAAYARMWQSAAGPRPYPFKAAQAREALGRLRDIQAAAAQWKAATVDLTEGAPKPLPLMRIVPIF